MKDPVSNHNTVNSDLAKYIRERVVELDEIPPSRKQKLGELAEAVSRKVRSGESVRMTFICTHNSRRSHMAQIWAQTAARYYGIPNVETYSGGAEATAFNPRAVAAMSRAGFRIEITTGGSNPVYLVRSHDDASVIEAYSKVFTDSPPNPESGFCAVMTCSHADEACPYVPGAEFRVSIPYEDPKAFDGTDQETAQYDARCAQICREMSYVFYKVSAEPTSAS